MHRILINLILSFCWGHPRLPRPFQDHGYDDDVIVERGFVNQDRDEVQFDVILNNQTEGVVLLIEVKGGIDNDEAWEHFEDQRARYERVTSTDIEVGSGISLPEDGQIDFDVTYCSPDDLARDIAGALGEDPVEVVFSCELDNVVDGKAFRRSSVVSGEMQDVELQRDLETERNPPVRIEEHYFPFDGNTDMLEIVYEIFPQIQTLYVDPDREYFTDSEVAERAIPVWPFFTGEYQNSIASVVHTAVQAVGNAPGEPSYSWDTGDDVWRFDRTGEERIGAGPPSLKKPAREYFAKEWDVDQIDAFLD